MKLNPEVYRRAARLIITKRYSFVCHVFYSIPNLLPLSMLKGCLEGQEAGRFNPYMVADMHMEYFTKLFKPKHRVHFEPWFGLPTVEEARERRVIALLLCADILEFENKENEKRNKTKS